MAKYFVYRNGEGILITKKTHRQLGHQDELLRSFNDIGAARIWAAKQGRPIIDTVTDKPKQERKKIPFKQRGPRPLEVRKKISRGMMGVNLGGDNPMWSRKHRPTSCLKMRVTPRRQNFKWCIDPSGKEHRRGQDATLPDGWIWGRNSRKWAKL